MAIFYAYHQTILGTQTTVNGSAADYHAMPSSGDTWRYSGEVFTHVVREENNSATNYNGDLSGANEVIGPNDRIGSSGAQTTEIDGTDRQLILELVFRVSDGTNTYDIAVVDVDLNNDNDVQDAGEGGYYLIFIGDIPPPDTDLTYSGIVSNNEAYSHTGLGGVVVCFTPGVLIETASGPVAVEDLRRGDMVETVDNGLQPIRWIGKRLISEEFLGKNPHLRPIRIRAGALGESTPAADLLISPQHRVLVRSRIAQRLFGSDEVLVAAKHLLQLDGVEVADDVREVSYIHFIFDSHQVVISNGAETESLYPGAEALKALDRDALGELFSIFPDLCHFDRNWRPESARILLSGKEGRKLAGRHAKHVNLPVQGGRAASVVSLNI